MTRRTLWQSALVLMIGMACQATQAMSLREFRHLEASTKQGKDYANYYLVGVMEGSLEAHAAAVRGGAQPSICVQDRRLEPHMARSLFDTELKRYADLYEADMPVQLVMHNALGKVYTC